MPVPLLLHGRHGGPTVAYEPLGQWIVPWRIASFEEEYRCLREDAGLIDYSTQAVIEVTGTDRVEFLQRLLTNDIARLSPGRGCRAALLTASGKLTAPLVVLSDPDALWLLCDLDRAEVVVGTLERHHFSEQVAITNEERRQAVLALQGPRTTEWLRQAMGASAATLKPCGHARASLQGLPVRVVRDSLSGEMGVLCLVDAAAAAQTWALVQAAGGNRPIRPVGWDALNTARIEAGIPWFGLDMDDTNLLPETGLEAVAVSKTKGCYLGQEIIARMDTYGSASKKLMGLLVDGDQVPARGARITRDGEDRGWVTSACRSPALQRPIALGYVKRGTYEPGTAVEVAVDAGRATATVVARPLLAGKSA